MFGNDRANDRHKAAEFGISFDSTGNDYRRSHYDRLPEPRCRPPSASAGDSGERAKAAHEDAGSTALSELGVSFDGKYYRFAGLRYARFADARDNALRAQDTVSSQSG
jgi:hypothetical protein